VRGIFGTENFEVKGSWKKMHNEKLHNLYTSPSIIIRIIKSKKIRWEGPVTRKGQKNDAHRVFVGKSQGERIVGRLRRKCEVKNKCRAIPVTGRGGPYGCETSRLPH
jgi:hypothetical protein